MKLLRVNMSTQVVKFEDLPERWKIYGGRFLCAKILNAEVPAQSDPLGPDAKLIFAASPLAGILVSSLGRISVGTKSPLKLGIKEANAGGLEAQKMDRLGIRAIIIEGAPPKGQCYTLHICKDGAVLRAASKYRGLRNDDLVEALYNEFSPEAGIMSIGIGGERHWKSATVAFTDAKGRPARHTARGGLGAVMGAKGLKAVIIDDRGTESVGLADKENFRETIRRWTEVFKNDSGGHMTIQ